MTLPIRRADLKSPWTTPEVEVRVKVTGTFLKRREHHGRASASMNRHDERTGDWEFMAMRIEECHVDPIKTRGIRVEVEVELPVLRQINRVLGGHPLDFDCVRRS